MNVTIIGTGTMGRGIGARLVAVGTELQLLDRSAQQAGALATELGGHTTAGQLGADPVRGDPVVLAVPYPAVRDVVGQVGDQLAGRIVVDISNPVDFTTFDGLATPPGTSAAEETAGLLPQARVVKAFNTTFGGTLPDGRVDGLPLDVFLASDDSGAADALGKLVAQADLRPVMVGPLRRARELEAMGYLHMVAQEPVGGGFRTGLKLIP